MPNKGELVEFLYDSDETDIKAGAERILSSVLDGVKAGIKMDAYWEQTFTGGFSDSDGSSHSYTGTLDGSVDFGPSAGVGDLADSDPTPNPGDQLSSNGSLSGIPDPYVGITIPGSTDSSTQTTVDTTETAVGVSSLAGDSTAVGQATSSAGGESYRFGEADPWQEEASNGSDPQPDILSGVTDPAELDGNDSLDLPPLPGITFDELDPEEREVPAELGGLPPDVFAPRDDPFDEPLSGGGEDELYGDGWDRLYGGTDTDGHDSADPAGRDRGDADEPSGGADVGAETIFGDAGRDSHEKSGEDEPGAGGGFGSETIFGGLDGDGIDGLDGDQFGGGDILHGAPHSGDPDLDGNDGLDLPMDPDFGETGPSALESLPGSALLDGLDGLGGGIGEDRLFGGGIDSYWSPSGGQGSGGGIEGRSQFDDSDQVNFEAASTHGGKTNQSIDSALNIGAVLDTDAENNDLSGLLENLGSASDEAPQDLNQNQLAGDGSSQASDTTAETVAGFSALESVDLSGGLDPLDPGVAIDVFA